MFIKLALRPNLIYPLQYLIWNAIRDIETTLINYFFNFSNSSIYCFLMFFGEFLSALIIFTYQKKFWMKKRNKPKTDHYHLPILSTKDRFLKQKDGPIKIIFLIFICAFDDFLQFFLYFHLSKFINISTTLGPRLYAIYTIIIALLYYYTLKFPLYRHHFFSLFMIGICLILVITFEFIFQEINIFLSYVEFLLALFIVFMIILCKVTLVLTEKYLYEFDNYDPFKALLYEGIFGLVLLIIYLIFNNPFKSLLLIYEKNSKSNFAIFIIALFIYVILSGGKNSFRMITTKIFTPMTTTFIDYFLNPVYMIYYFCVNEDFIKSNGEKKITQFIINLILSFCISFFGGVYNEFIILFFCELERDTHDQVKLRASIKESELGIVLEEDDV